MYDDFYKKCNRIKALIRADYADAYHDWHEGDTSLEEYVRQCFRLRLNHVSMINEAFTKVVRNNGEEHVRINKVAIKELTEYAVMVYNVFLEV